MDMALVNWEQKRLFGSLWGYCSLRYLQNNFTVLSLCCNGMELMSPDWYKIFYIQRPHSTTHCQLSSFALHTWSLILSIDREKQKLSKWFVSAHQQANDNKPARKKRGISAGWQCCVCSNNLNESKRWFIKLKTTYLGGVWLSGWPFGWGWS